MKKIENDLANMEDDDILKTNSIKRCVIPLYNEDSDIVHGIGY